MTYMKAALMNASLIYDDVKMHVLRKREREREKTRDKESERVRERV